MTEYTTRYLWENVFYTSEKDAQAAAAKFATDFANDKFLAVCDVIVVEPDPKRYNAFKVDKSNRLTTHPKNIADDDPRYFNVSSVEDGDTYTGIRAVALKRIHKEQFERFIVLRNLQQIIKTTFPARLIGNPDQSLKPGEHSNQEVIAVTAKIEYG
jgi:hypothetical protein|tara:strand:- start:211 stop:678 length:468 start_codon:yes stop_codon:yes gene_type:complete